MASSRHTSHSLPLPAACCQLFMFTYRKCPLLGIDNMGKRHIKLNSYKELAYLHPNYFTPDPSVLDELALEKDEKLVVLLVLVYLQVL